MTMTYRFASANHTDVNWRPKLTVTYTIPGQEQGASGAWLFMLAWGLAAGARSHTASQPGLA